MNSKLKRIVNITTIAFVLSLPGLSYAATPAVSEQASADINQALTIISALQSSITIPNISTEFRDQLAEHLDIVIEHINNGDLEEAQSELLGFMGTLTKNSYQILGKEDSILLDALYQGADLATYGLSQALQAKH